MNNSKTTLGGIIAVIGAVPMAIQHLGLTEVPSWLQTLGLVCTAVSFLYTTYQAQDRN